MFRLQGLGNNGKYSVLIIGYILGLVGNKGRMKKNMETNIEYWVLYRDTILT